MAVRTLTYRWRPVYAAILLLGIQAPSFAAVISILSSSFMVDGKAGASFYSTSVNGNSNSGSVVGTTGPPSDLSEWKASSSGLITTSGVALTATSGLTLGSGSSFINSGYSQVSLASIFQPLSSRITFAFTGSTGVNAFESWVDYILTDLTLGTQIQSKRWAQDRGVWGADSLPFTETYALDVTHQYELKLLARSSIGDSRQGYASLDLNIIPEPASAALLAIAAAGMTGLRRRSDF